VSETDDVVLRVYADCSDIVPCELTDEELDNRVASFPIEEEDGIR
jgi:hypothetical protein